MLDVTEQGFIGQVRIVHLVDDGEGRIRFHFLVEEIFHGERATGDGLVGLEGIVGLISPGALERHALGPFAAGCAEELEVLAGIGVGEGEKGAPVHVVLGGGAVVAVVHAGDADAAVEAAGEIHDPAAGVEVGAVGGGAFLPHLADGGVVPDLAHAAAGVGGVEPVGGVEGFLGRIVARRCEDRFLAFRCDHRRRAEADGKAAGLTVVAEAALGQVGAVGDIAVAGEAVELGEGFIEHVLVHLHAAEFGHEQEAHAVHAGGMDLAGADGVGESRRCPAPAPAAVEHVFLQLLGLLLDDGKHALVAGAQVILAKPPTHVAPGPIHPAEILDVLHPALHHREILVLTGGEQENDRSPLWLVLLSDKVGEIPDDLVGFRAIHGPGLAVGSHHRDVDGDFAGILDFEDDFPVLGLGLGDDVAEDDARIDFFEHFAVDALDDLAFLQLAGFLGGGARLHVADLHGHAGADQVDADPDRAEVSDKPWLAAVAAGALRKGVEDRGGFRRVVGFFALRVCGRCKHQCDHRSCGDACEERVCLVHLLAFSRWRVAC